MCVREELAHARGTRSGCAGEHTQGYIASKPASLTLSHTRAAYEYLSRTGRALCVFQLRHANKARADVCVCVCIYARVRGRQISRDSSVYEFNDISQPT